ncbi:MAG: Nif3-like dinuclear metal center hexameric protein, partial [Gammaproteobacteria bacterium]
RRRVVGVTASQQLLEAAVAADADAALVHHGYFWKNEPPCIVGIKRRRLQTLLDNGLSLLAYHLPLDAHPRYGNNVQLAQRLGLRVAGELAVADSQGLILQGELETPMTAAAFSAHVAQRLERPPLHLAGDRAVIRRIAWCSGGAQGYFPAVAASGVDAYLSGEVSESTTHVARETGVHFFAAGHHATERYGVQALAAHLAEKFSLQWRYVELDNPV